MTDSSDNDDLFEPVFKQKATMPASTKRPKTSKREAAPKIDASNTNRAPSLEEMKQKGKYTTHFFYYYVW